MPEETSTADTSNTGGQPDTKADVKADTGTQPDKPTETAKIFTQEEVSRLVAREVRKATEKATAEAATAEANAKKSLEEKLQSENDSLKSRLREREARDEFTRAAQKLKAPPRSAHAVFELGKSHLEYDKEGQPTNIKDVLADLQEEFPELFGIDKQTVNAGERDAETSPKGLFGVSRMANAYAESGKANGRR